MQEVPKARAAVKLVPAVPLEVKAINPLPLQTVKHSTVYLKITLPDGRETEGSGFFAVERGMVLTNAHVLGMLQRNSRPPRKIEVVVGSGSPAEKKYPGQILGVDRQTDLAFLRVVGQGLPPPLPLGSTGHLQELDRVFIFGFPFGHSLGKNITVSASSISSLRTDPEGKLQRLQVNGGMHLGNSGGPVTDAGGKVIGVAVGLIPGTQINFAIPADFVQGVLNGRFLGETWGLPFLEESRIKVAYELLFLDPLECIRQPQVEFWFAPTPPRPSKTQGVPPMGDGLRLPVPLTYHHGRACCELILPPQQSGQTLWRQVSYITGEGQLRRTAPAPVQYGLPLERKPANLRIVNASANRLVQLHSYSFLKFLAGNEAHSQAGNLQVHMREKIEPYSQGALVQLEYQGARFATGVDGKPVPLTAKVQKVVDCIPVLVFDLFMDAAGNLRRYRLNRTWVPEELRPDVSEFHEEIADSLEAVNFSMPGRTVQPGQKWTTLRALPLPSEDKADKGILEITCRYEGTRTRNGRKEAYLTLSGNIRGRPGHEHQCQGRATGLALFDLAAGQFSDIYLTMELDMPQKPVRGRIAQCLGRLDIRLHRVVQQETAAQGDKVTR